jgi:hypothetical protein
MKRLLLILSMVTMPVLGMQLQLPKVYLTQKSLCGVCGRDFEVGQGCTRLYPCWHIVHGQCAYRSGDECEICGTQTIWDRRKNFTFVQPRLIDNLVIRSEISVDLDQGFLTKALIKSNQNKRKKIDSFKSAYVASYMHADELIKENHQLRNALIAGASAALGLTATALIYKFLPNQTFPKVLFPGCCVSAFSYLIGNDWNKKLSNTALDTLQAIKEEHVKRLTEIEKETSKFNFTKV